MTGLTTIRVSEAREMVRTGFDAKQVRRRETIQTFKENSSNKDLWKVTRQEDINVEIRKFRWIGHTLRKEDGEIPKSTLFWDPQGNRKRGRPRNRWRRSANKEAGRSWNELRFLAADRQKWKGLIDNLCS